MYDIEVRQCTADDAEALAHTAADESVRGRVDHIRKWLEFNLKRGPGFTFEYAGRVICSWGVRIPRAGVGSAWAVVCHNVPYVRPLPTAEGFEYLAAVTAAVRRLLDIVAEDYGIKKIRAHSRKGLASSQRLLKLLGFERIRRQTKTVYVYRKLWK